MTSLSDLIDQTRDKISIDPNGGKFDNTLITQALNKGLEAIQLKTSFGSLQNKSTELNLALTGAETVLPSNFISLAQPTVIKWGGNTELKLVSYEEVRSMRDSGSNTGSPTFAYIRYDGADTVLGIFPVDTSKTVSFSYLISIGDVSAGNPYSSDYDEPLTSYATFYLLRNIRNFEKKAAMWKQEYLDSLKKVSTTRMTVDASALRFSGRRRNNR